jgi:hypothetical protein
MMALTITAGPIAEANKISTAVAVKEKDVMTTVVTMVRHFTWDVAHESLWFKGLLMITVVILVWELLKSKVCRRRIQYPDITPNVKPPTMVPDQAKEENAEEGAEENKDDTPLTIWVSPSGDKFHWNRECRGLAAVPCGSKKKRSECLHCRKLRLAKAD